MSVATLGQRKNIRLSFQEALKVAKALIMEV